MGLFSSSYKYYAYAGSSVLLPAEEREHTVKSLMLQSKLNGIGTMADAIKMGLQTDMYRRAMKMAKYAAKPDGYPYGFPTNSHTYYYLPWATLRPFVEADAGGPVDVRSYYMGEWGTDAANYFIEARINETYTDTNYFPWKKKPEGPIDTNWSPVDDEIEIPVILSGDKGAKYYATSNNQWTYVETGDNIQITFPWEGEEYDKKTKANVPVSGTFDVEQPYDMSLFKEGTWLRVKYRMTGETDEYRYWYYQIDSNEDPYLESLIERVQFEAEYLPIAIMMHDKVWFNERQPRDLEFEDKLDHLIRYLTMDAETVKEDFIYAIENPEEGTPADQIPSMDDIWDFFVQFSMPLRTTDRAAREYLFHYYRFLKGFTEHTFEDYQEWLSQGSILGMRAPQPHTKYWIEEGEQYTGYIARYAWSYISETTFDGVFTPPGWDRPLKTRELWSEEYALTDPDYNYGLNLVHGEGNYQVSTFQREDEEHSYALIVRQNRLADGDGLPTYTAILMMGPSMEYQINTSSEPVGVGAGGYVDYRYRFVDCKLFPDDPEQNTEFRWPIHIGSLRKVSAMRREPALQEALCGTVFLVDEVKVKWYQRSFFKWLIIIIVVVVVILAQQYELLGTVQAMASTAFAAGATATAIALTALYVTLVFAIGFLISFAGSLIGGTWGKIFIILASLYMAGGLNMFSNIGASWGNMTANFGWGTATTFLQSIGPVVQIGQIIIEDRALAKLESQMRDFTKTAKEKYEELQDAWDEFGGKPSYLDPLDLVNAFRGSWYVEQPDNYFQRTLNANPGLLGYDMVNEFAQLALTLPVDGNPNEFMTGLFNDMERQRGAV